MMVSYREIVMRRIDDDLAEKSSKASEAVNRQVLLRVPVLTGRLFASYERYHNADGFVVGTNLYYAKYQELGTRYQRGTAHLRPGLLAAIPEMVQIYGAEIRE